jgi:hypothetical protein
MDAKYVTTGIERLDEILGGGFVQGTQNVVRGATGVGKTRLLVQISAAQPDHPGIFYDIGMTSDRQPIADWFRHFHGREVGYWNRELEQEAHRLDIIAENTDIQKAIILPYGNVSGNNPFRKKAMYKADAESLAKSFFTAHFHLGSDLVIVDGFRNPGQIPGIMQVQAMDYFTLWNRIKHNELVAGQCRYRPEKVTFVSGETTDFDNIDLIRTHYNRNSPVAPDASTVILLGYDADGRTVIMDIPKMRHKKRDGLRYRVVEAKKKLDLEQI